MSNAHELQEIVCCLGQPVAGNPTQYMLERAFEHHGLDWRYLTLEVPPEGLEDAVRGMRAMGFRGGDIIRPHKLEVIKHLDGTSEAASLIGAVNCVNRLGDQLIGENTDGKAFVQTLRHVADPAEKRFAILGAGGAARALAVELGLAGASEITIINRTAEHGQELADLLKEKVHVTAQWTDWEGDYQVPDGVDVLINATSIGLFDPQARVPVDVATLRPDTIVADCVFNPPDTKLLAAARERGCTVSAGLDMLVNQSVLAFNLWTGMEPERLVLVDALEEFLGI